MNVASLLSRRSANVLESGIRKVFEEARDVRDPINLSLGQPDFPVPDAVKQAAVDAILHNQNGYSSNRGLDPLLEALSKHLAWDLGWDAAAGPKPGPGQAGLMVTSGTSGGLVAAAMSLLEEGDEFIIPDPYFVLYPPLAQMTGATAVLCDTYPDFRMTAERVEKLITPRTKAVLFNSPSNPSGVVSPEKDVRELLELCQRRNVLLISDEIYDEFTFSESLTQPAAGDKAALRCPSPCRRLGGRDAGEQESVLLIRGFGKTYGCTGWRLGYAAGPATLIARMNLIQQHVYICAPTPLQAGALAALRTPPTDFVREYERRRDLVCSILGEVTHVARPGGAFYAFVEVPRRLKMTGTQFKEKAKDKRVLIVPSGAFGQRDTHFRLSFATNPNRLEEGLMILRDLMK
jgi:aspartate/methionine/tyrosine aminotransferase